MIDNLKLEPTQCPTEATDFLADVVAVLLPRVVSEACTLFYRAYQPSPDDNLKSQLSSLGC